MTSSEGLPITLNVPDENSITVEVTDDIPIIVNVPDDNIITVDLTSTSDPTTFLNLVDTPDTYTAQAGKAVTVKTDESGLQFTDISGSGNLVKVSSTDSTSGYLQQKIVAGTNISLTKQNVGDNETLKIDSVTTYTSNFLIADWTANSSLYYLDVVHNLNTSTPIVTFSNGDMVHIITITNVNTIRLWVTNTFDGYVKVIK